MRTAILFSDQDEIPLLSKPSVTTMNQLGLTKPICVSASTSATKYIIAFKVKEVTVVLAMQWLKSARLMLLKH